MMMAQEPFTSAEVSYRLDRATTQYRRAQEQRPGTRRHLVPRRPTLHLPHPRLRPLTLA